MSPNCGAERRCAWAWKPVISEVFLDKHRTPLVPFGDRCRSLRIDGNSVNSLSADVRYTLRNVFRYLGVSEGLCTARWVVGLEHQDPSFGPWTGTNYFSTNGTSNLKSLVGTFHPVLFFSAIFKISVQEICFPTRQSCKYNRAGVGGGSSYTRCLHWRTELLVPALAQPAASELNVREA